MKEEGQGLLGGWKDVLADWQMAGWMDGQLSRWLNAQTGC